MHARYYRQRLGGKKPSEILRGFVLELGRMASQVDDMQERSALLEQVSSMEDLTLAVQEMEAEIEDLDGQQVRESLLNLVRPGNDSLDTSELLSLYLAQEEEAERSSSDDLHALEEEVANLKRVIQDGGEALKGVLATLVVPE
jgi:hypothetical protein